MNALKAIQTGLAAAILAAAAITAGAQPGPAQGPGFGMHRPPMERMLGPGGAHGRWWNNPDVVDKLKLTDDQRKSMDAILQQHREKLIDMRANVEKAEVAMDPLVNADQPNESAILAQIDKVAQARAELEKANARFLLELRAKLTPEQWKQLQAMRSERRDHRGDGQFRRRGPGAPGQPGSDGGAGTPPPPAGPQGVSFQQPAPVQDGDFAPVPEIGTI